MPEQTSLFRTSKTRNSRTQEQLKSTLLAYKQSPHTKITSNEQYHQTYAVPLPKVSIDLLQPLLDGLTNGIQPVDPETRMLYTIGTWNEGSDAIYRCCFVQPEIATCSCSFSSTWKPTAEDVLYEVSEMFPNANPCNLSKAIKYPQLSGRMTPYVVEHLPFSVNWGFVNICRSYFLFIVTDIEGPHLMSISKFCMEILQSYFPEYSTCIRDSTTAYKITVEPDPGGNINEPNKNSCLYVYSDGSFRYQGHPNSTKRVCQSFKEAIMNISKSRAWGNFVNKLNTVPQNDHQDER